MKHTSIKHKLRHLPRAAGKLPRPQLKQVAGRWRGKPDAASRLDAAVKDLPNITNDTVAQHREEVLAGARKYIYPLKHSKHRAVIISTSLVALIVVVFFAYCGLALYKFQANDSFIYGVTQIIPFPIAKVGSQYVAYENYLFDLRHYEHYYETQEKINFASKSGQAQLASYKKQAFQDVVNAAYVQQLAERHHISVSDQAVDSEISLVRQQDRLGDNQQEFKDVLSQFWGWSVADFKRALKQQLLSQKVAATLDTATQQRAQAALNALQHGSSFVAVAAQYSDDATTKAAGGEFGFTIDKTTQSVSPQTLQTLLSLKPGQTSGIVDLGDALEIDQVISSTNGQIKAAHILFSFKPISDFTQPLAATEPAHAYIGVN